VQNIDVINENKESIWRNNILETSENLL